MATYTSTRKTLIIPGSSSKTFHYNDGDGDIYINSSILRKNQGENSIEVEPINDNFVIYFDSSVNVISNPVEAEKLIVVNKGEQLYRELLNKK